MNSWGIDDERAKFSRRPLFLPVAVFAPLDDWSSAVMIDDWIFIKYELARIVNQMNFFLSVIVIHDAKRWRRKLKNVVQFDKSVFLLFEEIKVVMEIWKSICLRGGCTTG